MTAIEYVEQYIKEHESDWCDSVEDYFDEVGYDNIEIENLGGSRWWDNYFCAIKIGNRFIGFNWAKTTGDDTPKDKGWDFDKSSICFLEPYTETITVTKYKIINEI